MADHITKMQKLHSTFKYPIAMYSILACLYVAAKPGKYIWFSFHPIAMIIGFVALAGNAILLKKIGGYENTKTHGLLFSIAIAVAAFGWFVIYSNKEMAGKEHLTTTHSQLGMAVLLGYLGLGLFGGVALHPDWGALKTNQQLRTVHKWAGRVMTAGSWYVCVLGFASMRVEMWQQLVAGVPLLVFGFYFLL